MSPALKTALSTKMDRHEMVSLYAKAGLWYDALREALGSADLRESFHAVKDLAKLEEPEATQVQSGQCEPEADASSEGQQGTFRI